MKYWKVEKDMTNAQYAKTELQQHIKFGIWLLQIRRGL